MRINTLDRMAVGMTFAEAGEWESARDLAGIKGAKVGLWERLRNTFAAVSFAEEGLHKEARAVMDFKEDARAKKGLKDFLEDVGLGGVQFHLVVVRA